MNPIAKCCGFYCAFLMILGVFFNLILICMIAAGSEFLARDGQTEDRMYALGGACVVKIFLTVFS
jgi:Sec-independent protein secretion pathway component TatC